MSLISLILVLVIEQFRPLSYARWVATPLQALADWGERHFNAGTERHGLIGWLVVVGGLSLLAAVVHFLLAWQNGFAALGWSVLMLYLTMGFRQFSHHYTEIHLALRLGEIDRARALLAEWREEPQQMWSSGDIARLAIEQALLASHRHVFAVLFWFVLLPGPSGAVLYRVSAIVADRWRGHLTESEPFAQFAQRAFAVIDWLPQRITATGFAIVGDFEDAVHCWRTQAAAWIDRSAGIVLAAGAGALGVKLGMPLEVDGEVRDREGLGLGVEPDEDVMQSAVGLVWRALVLWLLLLFLLSLASLVG